MQCCFSASPRWEGHTSCQTSLGSCIKIQHQRATGLRQPKQCPLCLPCQCNSPIRHHSKSDMSGGCLFSFLAHIPQHSSCFCASGDRIRQRCLVLLESPKSPSAPTPQVITLLSSSTCQIWLWSHFTSGAAELFPRDALTSKWPILYPQLIPKIKNPTRLDLSKSKAGILISSVARSALVQH